MKKQMMLLPIFIAITIIFSASCVFALEYNNDYDERLKDIELRISKIEESEMKQDLDNIKESRFEDYKELRNMIDDNISKNDAVFLFSILGIGVISIFLNIQKIINVRLESLLNKKSDVLINWVKSHEYEEQKRKNVKLLVISQDEKSQNIVRQNLNRIFKIENLTYITWDKLESENLLEDNGFPKSAFIKIVKHKYKSDIIFFDNNSEDGLSEKDTVKHIKTLISELDKNINIGGYKLCYFYFNKNGVQLRDTNHSNFSNSESTIYSNLMSLIKYRDFVMDTKK